MQSIEQVHLQRVDYDKPIQLLVLTSHFAPIGVFWQMGLIMWLHMPASPSRVVTPYYDSVLQLLWKDRKLSTQTFGKQPDRVVVPYVKDQLTHLQQ